jgi:hypothetical protein
MPAAISTVRWWSVTVFRALRIPQRSPLIAIDARASRNSFEATELVHGDGYLGRSVVPDVSEERRVQAKILEEVDAVRPHEEVNCSGSPN